jgi:hypothetical protein
MPVRGLGSGMTREQAYSGNEIGMHIFILQTRRKLLYWTYRAPFRCFWGFMRKRTVKRNV